MDTSLHHAPAAISMVSCYVNSAIGSRIPDSKLWRQALSDDPMTRLLCDIVTHPKLAEDSTKINSLHFIYRQLARLGLFYMDDGILFLEEIYKDDTKYVSLQIVPTSLHNIIFIAFHANPIGGHLNAYRTCH